MGSISYDSRRGRLVAALVWNFWIGADWEKASDLGWAYGEWIGRQREDRLHECPTEKSHQTGTRTTAVEVDLFGGKVLPDCLALTNHGFPIISNSLATRLKASGLTGYKLFDDVVIAENMSDARDPHCQLLDVVGKGGFCLRWQVKDAPNICPYCKKEPILCAGCGWRDFYDCPRCGRRVHHGGGYEVAPDGKSLRLEPGPDKLIVEAKDWDGSDLFCVRGHGGGWFANRRAKSWFEKCHILGVEFEESLLNLEGVDI